MLSYVYRILTDLGAPVIRLYLWRRRQEGREDPERFNERLGYASVPRPAGPLIWCHASSLGEAASLLTLIEKLRDIYPTQSVLITTGTVTSARMLDKRRPLGVIHQYMPVDRAPYVKRFLHHWKPDFVLWVESEFWPNMLAALREHLTPTILLNARMSEKSFHNWYRVKGWAGEILGTFSLCLTQTEEDRTRFVALGAKPVRCHGNLKYAANPLPYDEQEWAAMKKSVVDRTLWVMASSHRGEEEIAIDTHKKLRVKYPHLLTIIVPRHAARGGEVARLIRDAGLTCARRSLANAIQPSTDIYLADTMGELGLFYRLSHLVCLAGSFNWGGHNPIEPAQLGCTILFGPSMHNFAGIAREFVHHQAAMQLQHQNELAFTLDRLLADGVTCIRYAQTALTLADQKRHVLEQILGELRPWLSPESRRAA
jgi:3-deoxy-D-manno-octulosonic-acid transferase